MVLMGLFCGVGGVVVMVLMGCFVVVLGPNFICGFGSSAFQSLVF